MASTAKLVSRLPVSYVTSIGRIITRWAGVEWELQRIVYMLLNVNAKQGRLAAKVPRAGECANLIKQLAKLRGIYLSAKDVSYLHSRLSDCVEWRDRLAHGVWIRPHKTRRLLLQVTKGAWNDPRGESRSRKILPEGMQVTIGQLRALTRDIELVGTEAHDLYLNLRLLLRTSQEKHEPLLGYPSSLDTSPQQKPKHQPSSSQE